MQLLGPFILYILLREGGALSVSSHLLEKDDVFTINREDHQVSKRSSPHLNQELLTNLTGTETRHVKKYVSHLNSSHNQLLVHWAGEGLKVITCLAKFAGLNNASQSSIFISYDYGKSFNDKTPDLVKLLDNNSSIVSIHKFHSHKKNKKFTVFVDKFQKSLFLTDDFGVTFRRKQLEFSPVEFYYHPDNPFIFCLIDENKTLWVTKNFGWSFSVLQQMVKTLYWTGSWAEERQILIQRQDPESTQILSVSLDNSSSPTQLFRNAVSFRVVDDFMFVTKMTSKTNQALYISYKGGSFQKAVFDSELELIYFHIADVTDTRILIAAAHSETLVNLYVTEVTKMDRYLCRLSLERIFLYVPGKLWKLPWLGAREEPFVDIHKVAKLKGIFIASQVTQNANSSTLSPENLVTLITFDWGGEWKKLKPPRVDHNGETINCTGNCSLHLGQEFSFNYPAVRTVPILSAPSSPGLIIATGTLGVSLKGHIGVYMSNNAGLTWRQILREHHLFNIGDHGGIITATKFFKSSSETNEILYSTNEGKDWNSILFSEEEIKVYGLMTEPGENATVFTVFGSQISKHGWLIVNMDLMSVFARNCTKEDYKIWSPSWGTDQKMSCILGEREVFERRLPNVNCFNGRSYDRLVEKERCFCDIEDFECDFRFVRRVGSLECVRNKATGDPYTVPDSCVPGEFYNRTKGYRKIGGDKCFGGRERELLPAKIPCPVKERNEFLIVSQHDKILRFDINNNITDALPVKGISSVIAVDFDMKSNCVYFADIMSDKIGRQCLNGTRGVEILVEKDLASVEGIALDWISNNLYFVDKGRLLIEAIRTDVSHSGRMRIVIVERVNLTKPRGIALHPVEGYLYWTDWSDTNPSISRAYLDGSNIVKLFGDPIVKWPNGISVDFFAERIYWVDAKLDYIGRSDLHGKNFRKVISEDQRVSHPFSVAILKDNLYWDDWTQEGFFVAEKEYGYAIELLRKGFKNLMDLKVFSHSLQTGTNGCAGNNSCSHLCFAQPDNKPPVCRCPQGMLQGGGKCLCPDGSTPLENDACPLANKTCLSQQFKCKTTALCIPQLWVCDGRSDCTDNSDEENCKNQTCAGFLCGNGKCIPEKWICDYENDCPDGSDERNCTFRECPGQFKCNNSKCINNNWVCDGEDDCKDGSDEVDCPSSSSAPSVCKNDQFACTNKVCIPISWKCDGEHDCGDGSDEGNCSNYSCPPSKFRCAKNDRCIDTAWLCDGESDCGDGDNSDESNCTTSSPPTIAPFQPDGCLNSWMFKCSNGHCIPVWWKCDGVDDCNDLSDEQGCPSPTNATMVIPGPPSRADPSQPSIKCKENQFQCLGENTCVLLASVCDGIIDCPDGSDEKRCTSTSCRKDQFKCRYSGSCIRMSEVCNGRAECPDKTDEVGCESQSNQTIAFHCDPGYFQCDHNECIPLDYVCNFHFDCVDETDEICDERSRGYQVLELNLDPQSMNASSARISWTYPKDAPELKFVVSFQELPQLKWVDIPPVKTHEFVLNDLKPFTEYKVKVSAARLNQTEFTPAIRFLRFKTSEGIPSPPWNVTASQKRYSDIEVRWAAPRQPAGILTEYKVFMSPPFPPLETSVPGTRKTAKISTILEPGTSYHLWVTALNEVGSSQSSNSVFFKPDPEANLGRVSSLKVDIKKKVNINSLVEVSWDPSLNATKTYRVSFFAKPPYPKLETIETNTTRVSVDHLAPGGEYTVEVTPFNEKYEGLTTTRSFSLPGREMPVVSSLKGTLNEDGTFTISWKPPSTPVELFNVTKSWTYGVYVTTSGKDIFLVKPWINAQRSSGTLKGLQPCTTYVVDVAITEPLGPGPLSAAPITFTTPYSAKAEPKDLQVNAGVKDDKIMIVSWKSPCGAVEESHAYYVSVFETTFQAGSNFHVRPNSSLWHDRFHHSIVVNTGAKYRIKVRTDVVNSSWSPEVEYWAPELPVPHQLHVVRKDNQFIVYWSQSDSKNISHYELLVSESRSLNGTSAKIYNATAPPLSIMDLKEETIYSFAVRMVNDLGYKSELSETGSYEFASQDEWTQGLAKSGLLPYLLPIGIVFATVLVVLVIFIVRNRQLHNSFTNFVNSHYSARSGAATFTSTDGLDDEDYPVIRGFSDDEPLVVA